MGGGQPLADMRFLHLGSLVQLRIGAELREVLKVALVRLYRVRREAPDLHKLIEEGSNALLKRGC